MEDSVDFRYRYGKELVVIMYGTCICVLRICVVNGGLSAGSGHCAGSVGNSKRWDLGPTGEGVYRFRTRNLLKGERAKEIPVGGGGLWSCYGVWVWVAADLSSGGQANMNSPDMYQLSPASD